MSEEVAKAMSAIEGRLARLIEEVRRLRGDVQSLSTAVSVGFEKVSSEVTRTRLDISTRLILASATLSLVSYIAAASRIEALKRVVSSLKDRASEAEKLYRDKIIEILKDYLSAIKHFFGHFTRRAELDFLLMREALNLEKVVRSLYERLKPEYVDAELVELAVDEDTERRALALKEIGESLGEVSSLLQEASTLKDSFQKLCEKYAIDGIADEEGVLLFLPTLKLEVRLDGRAYTQLLAPCEEWGKRTTLSERISSYAASAAEWRPVEVTPSHIREAKSILRGLARSKDEEKLVEEMEIEVE